MVINASSTLVAFFALVSRKEGIPSSLIADHPSCGKITFISHKQLIDILTCILIDFIQPLLNIVEALLIYHIVYNNNPMCITIVTASDCPEPLWTKI